MQSVSKVVQKREEGEVEAEEVRCHQQDWKQIKAQRSVKKNSRS